VAEPARTPAAEDGPPVDPVAVDRAYVLHRARRQARIDHLRASRRAGIRFWVVLLVLLGASSVIGLSIWHEIQRLFGL